MNWQIAIDGPAGSGKSTIARGVSKRLKFEHIDTGAMYRAVTLKALKLNINLENEEEFEFLKDTKIDFVNQKIFLDGENVTKKIRTIKVTNNVSLVSKYGYVRTVLVSLQQNLAKSKNVIMDGRDIGTVVLPNANLKIFLTATVEERARRRMNERLLEGLEVGSFEETIQEIAARDLKDSTRLISPLKIAEDAIVIDSSNLSVEDVIEKIISLVCERGYDMEKEQKMENVEVTEEAAKVEEVKEVAETVENEENAAVEEATVEEETAKEDAPKYKELQVVTGTVEEILEAQPETASGKKVFKAKEERVLISLEDGQEGYLFRKDTANIKDDEDLIDIFCEGDKVEVAIKKIFPDGGKFIFSTALLEKRKELEQFGANLKRDTVFTAKVLKQIQVGLLMKYEDFSCLLPTSQVSVPEEEIASLVGKEIAVAPIRVDYGRIRIIVSQVLADKINNRATKKAFVESLEVGQVFDGVVKNIENYGAFVEIGKDVEGLLHISEIDHNRVFKIEKVLKVGDPVKVQIIKLEKDHIGLSRKSLIPNYWEEYINGKSIENIVKGQVAEINNSGVVVTLAPEVNGFLPKSEFAWEKDVKIDEVVKLGDELEVKIIEIDSAKKRIILSRKQLSENPWNSVEVKVGDIVNVKVNKILPEGFIVAVGNVEGYLPKVTVRSIAPESIQLGQELKAKVRILDADKNKLVVSMRDAEERAERPERVERPERTEKYDRRAKDSSYNNPAIDKFQDKMTNTFGDFVKQGKRK